MKNPITELIEEADDVAFELRALASKAPGEEIELWDNTTAARGADVIEQLMELVVEYAYADPGS